MDLFSNFNNSFSKVQGQNGFPRWITKANRVEFKVALLNNFSVIEICLNLILHSIENFVIEPEIKDKMFHSRMLGNKLALKT